MTAAPSRRDLNRGLLAAVGAILAPASAARPAAVPLFDFAVAGGWFHGLRAARAALAPGARLRVAAEFDNPHDPNAVAVLGPDGARLGYLPRRANPPVAALLRAGARFEAVVRGPIEDGGPGAAPDGLVFTGYDDGDPRLTLVRVG